jgi:uncharacterized protein (DUF305 family)
MADLLNNIIDSAINETLKTLQEAATDPPTFKPNPNSSEGKPSPEELNHRQQLQDTLEDLYNQIIKIIRAKNNTPDTDITQIDNLTAQLTQDLQTYNTKTVNSRFQDGWDLMIKYVQAAIKKAKKNIRIPQQPTVQPRLQSIQTQQNQNVEDISYFLRGRIRQIINMRSVKSYYQTNQKIKQSLNLLKQDVDQTNWTPCMKALHTKNPNLTEDELEDQCEAEDNTNSAFNRASNNLDQLGIFGWLESQTAGFLAAAIWIMAVISTLNIKIPWVTCDDNGNCASPGPVCDDCEGCKADGPYDPNDFPPWQHDGDRCNDPPGEPVITFS